MNLPSRLGTDKAEASFDNDILTLIVLKSEQNKPKHIKIKAKGAIKSKE